MAATMAAVRVAGGGGGERTQATTKATTAVAVAGVATTTMKGAHEGARDGGATAETAPSTAGRVVAAAAVVVVVVVVGEGQEGCRRAVLTVPCHLAPGCTPRIINRRHGRVVVVVVRAAVARAAIPTTAGKAVGKAILLLRQA